MAVAAKSIFVTGAGSGIGRATALLFAERGWFVGLYDVSASGLAETSKLIAPDRQITGQFDVRDAEAWKQAVSQFGDVTGGKMHALFNNAGIARHGWFEDVPEADADLIVDVNIKGVINGCYAALPLLKATQGARLINVASVAGMIGAPKLAVYTASKFAVRGLTEALNAEFQRHGVGVCCLMPWFIDTPILNAATSGTNQQMKDAIKQQGSDVYPVSIAAEAAWAAAHGDETHYPVGKRAKESWTLSRWFPKLVANRIRKQMIAPS
jgi:NAD(P)-dependent dehydrogenase (short-subunit alcohol dehydrogenase family)